MRSEKEIWQLNAIFVLSPLSTVTRLAPVIASEESKREFLPPISHLCDQGGRRDGPEGPHVLLGNAYKANLCYCCVLL